ncbi:MAG: hypothetical protein SAJ37_03160 [Oscillatoria sp. PMC 1068.18]|nr:hypothetical protein [Oscillatoria sp. PMC 1076.18]MEC4987724.1 hypothetical protein [Oscillatoria sp. PMC 1068.18]
MTYQITPINSSINPTQNPNLEELKLKLELVREQQNLLDKSQVIMNNYGAETLQLMLGQANSLLQPTSETVFGRSGSRMWLLKALEEAKEGVRMVCPWLSRRSVDQEMQLRIRYLLDQGLYLHIGWGYGYDIGKVIKLERGSFSISNDGCRNYDALSFFKQLRDKYPEQVQLKFLGSHSKYFVRDRAFAYVGSHNFLNSNLSQLNTYSPDFAGDEVGTILRTPKEIEKLIQRFDHQPDLAKQRDYWDYQSV